MALVMRVVARRRGFAGDSAVVDVSRNRVIVSDGDSVLVTVAVNDAVVVILAMNDAAPVTGTVNDAVLVTLAVNDAVVEIVAVNDAVLVTVAVNDAVVEIVAAHGPLVVGHLRRAKALGATKPGSSGVARGARCSPWYRIAARRSAM
ncbi:MAG TPA: hypothetical protein VGM91_12515 [Conexibacter sp.]